MVKRSEGIGPKHHDSHKTSSPKRTGIARELMASSENVGNLVYEGGELLRRSQQGPTGKEAKLSKKKEVTQKPVAGKTDKASQKSVFANKSVKTLVLPRLGKTNTSFAGNPKHK